MDPRAEIALKLSRDKVMAHAVLFPHRHPDETPDFIREMIRSWYGSEKYVGWLVFRGGTKSTTAEEALCIETCFQSMHNCIVIGDTGDRAIERLSAIKHELETNERIIDIFGELRGSTWTDDEIVTSTGIRLLALGRGQAIRGIKFRDRRPDRWFCDDLEKEDTVLNPDTREKMRRWFMKELIPAGDPRHKGRMAATPLDPEALPLKLAEPGSGWVWKTFPIEYTDRDGKRAPTWPGRFPLDFIDNLKRKYTSLGMLREYNMEYMCKASTPEEKPFKNEMFRTEIRQRSWEPVYCMFDPARTIGANSATTGYAAWSWIANRLIVWDAWGKMLLPDQIVEALFTAHNDFSPAWIGVEEDGLNEWLKQPIRHEMSRRHVTVPVKAVKAPRGKLDFIRSLQPFFNAREIVFAKDMPDLKQQLLSFPTGKIDAPNALAYALKMRPGAPIYEDFSQRHVAANLDVMGNRPAWLAMNASAGVVMGVLVQFVDGTIRILRDWVYEGDPGQMAKTLVDEAKLECSGQTLRTTSGPMHWDKWNNVGLVQALKRVPIETRRTGVPEPGRDFIRELLRKEMRGLPALLVSEEARWTLNGFAAAYCRAVGKGSILTEHAEEGVYRLLMEGLECFAGLIKAGVQADDDENANYGYTSSGKRYLTSLPGR